MTDEMIDEVAIIGSAEECKERLLWDGENGVHTHIIAPLGGSTPEEAMRTFKALTPEKMGV